MGCVSLTVTRGRSLPNPLLAGCSPARRACSCLERTNLEKPLFFHRTVRAHHHGHSAAGLLCSETAVCVARRRDLDTHYRARPAGPPPPRHMRPCPGGGQRARAREPDWPATGRPPLTRAISGRIADGGRRVSAWCPRRLGVTCPRARGIKTGFYRASMNVKNDTKEKRQLAYLAVHVAYSGRSIDFLVKRWRDLLQSRRSGSGSTAFDV